MTVSTRRAVVVEGTVPNQHQASERLALVKSDGTSAFSYTPLVTATAIGTAAKTVSSPEPGANTLVAIKFTNGNSAASPTVSFNGGTARAVLLGGTAPLNTEITLANNGVAMFLFDGTNLHQLGVYV